MINLKQEEKERCQVDPQFLCEMLDRELSLTKNNLVTASPDNVSKLQGRAQALHDVITLLHRA